MSSWGFTESQGRTPQKKLRWERRQIQRQRPGPEVQLVRHPSTPAVEQLTERRIPPRLKVRDAPNQPGPLFASANKVLLAPRFTFLSLKAMLSTQTRYTYCAAPGQSLQVLRFHCSTSFLQRFSTLTAGSSEQETLSTEKDHPKGEKLTFQSIQPSARGPQPTDMDQENIPT